MRMIPRDNKMDKVNGLEPEVRDPRLLIFLQEIQWDLVSSRCKLKISLSPVFSYEVLMQSISSHLRL
ncbi:unnamed protein product [Sphenostylis stenocarpa]|uniref:Uncharacterized protein n=1 Tax=Sphenostylis stenocarpa TaxID=92480 RepID=A0AA86T1U7_9FABA|nr:unnamed protein product [Sphenostylis stenocarpa]